MQRFGYTRPDPVEQSAVPSNGPVPMGPNAAALARAGVHPLRMVFEAEPGDKLWRQLRGMQRGDQLVVVSIADLADTTAGLRPILQKLEDKGLKIRVLQSRGHPGDPPMKKIESDFRLAGMQRAKASGKHIGRPPSVDVESVRKLFADGLGVRAIAKQLGIGRSSVSRVLNSARKDESAQIPWQRYE
jgi:DNA invertase Pin-like site-specific DNA recombinase